MYQIGIHSYQPDLNNNYPNNLNQYLIIGDSYAEGTGDAFLNNKYNYSTAHG